MLQAHLWGPAGDTQVWLALDSGADATVIRTATLISIGCDPTHSPDRVQITTVSGVDVVPRLPIYRMEVLGRQRIGFSVLCHSLPPAAATAICPTHFASAIWSYRSRTASLPAATGAPGQR
jgi:hypothetical protein